MNAVGNLGVVNWHEDTKFDNASAKTGMNTRLVQSSSVFSFKSLHHVLSQEPTGFGIFIATQKNQVALCTAKFDERFAMYSLAEMLPIECTGNVLK